MTNIPPRQYETKLQILPTPLLQAAQERRVIVFIDESGLSERPTRVRTWAPTGQTPIIQYQFNWKHVSVIAGLTPMSCLFRFRHGSIKSPQIVEFRKALRQKKCSRARTSPIHYRDLVDEG